MSNHLDRAERKYTHRPFEEAHNQTRQFCVVLAYLSQAIGAVLASYYIYHQIGLPLLPKESGFQIILAVFTTAFILLALESFKRIFITIGFRKCLKKYVLLNRQNFMGFVIALSLLCICFSVITSYKGAQLYTSTLNNKTELVQREIEEELNQILIIIDQDIASKKQKVNALEKREQKRRWGLTDNEAASLKLAYQNIQSLKAEKQALKTAYKQKVDQALKSEKEKFNQSLWPIIVFAVLLELITIGCIGFMEFFDVQIVKEQSQVSASTLEHKYPDLVKALRKNKIRNRPVPMKSFVYQYGVSESTIKRLNKQLN